MKKLKVFLLVILTIFTIGSSATPVRANAWDTIRDVATTIGEVYRGEKSFLEALLGVDGENIVQMVNKFLTAIITIPISWVCPVCLDADGKLAQSDVPEYRKYGLMGIMENQITAMFNSQPRIDVIAHLSEEWVPGYRETKSVYALNTGYQDLMGSRIDALWSFTRNIAYIGFVFVMIVIGFMIMFRSKIGGQTIVTIGNTLPRIIISLILVTFSFAIIGLIFDLTGFVTQIVSAVLHFEKSHIPVHNVAHTVAQTLGWTGLAYIVLSIMAFLGSVIVGFAIPAAVPFGVFILLIMLLVLTIIVFGAIKLWVSLVKTYLVLLLNTVLAPLAILVGALPGSEAVTVNIFKTILRSALVFPLAFAIVNIPHFLMETLDISLVFPESIVRSETYLGPPGGPIVGSIVGAVLSILALYYAAKAPEYMKAIIPPSQPRGGIDIGAVTKESLSKVPILGKRLSKSK
jgi:hypothetical protein